MIRGYPLPLRMYSVKRFLDLESSLSIRKYGWSVTMYEHFIQHWKRGGLRASSKILASSEVLVFILVYYIPVLKRPNMCYIFDFY